MKIKIKGYTMSKQWDYIGRMNQFGFTVQVAPAGSARRALKYGKSFRTIMVWAW